MRIVAAWRAYRYGDIFFFNVAFLRANVRHRCHDVRGVATWWSAVAVSPPTMGGIISQKALHSDVRSGEPGEADPHLSSWEK